MTSLMVTPRPLPEPTRPSKPHGDEPETDGSVPIGELWLILRHRTPWILGGAALLAAAALLYCLTTPWLYAASAQILVDPRDKVVVNNDINPSAMSPDGGLAQVESQTRVLQSSNVLLRAIAATGIAHDPEFVGTPGLLGRLRHKFDALLGKSVDSDLDQGDRDDEQALQTLRRKLAVKRDDKVFVIDLTVTAQAPDKAARIANAIVDAYLADQAEARSDAAERASDSLVARLSEQKAKVTAAENAVERYKADNAMVTANGVLMSDQQLTDANRDLANAQARTAELRARMDQIERARRSGPGDGATAEAIGSTVISQLRARNAELVQHEADLATQYGPRHPAIASVKSQLHDVRQLIATELDRIARSARADYERARANEEALQKAMARQTAETLVGKQASVKLRELERDLDANRTVYATFLLRAQETREQANIDSPNARVITRALPPLDRSWPLIVVLVAGATAAGLGLGAAAAFGFEVAAPTILSREQLRRVLGVPVVTSILGPRRDGRGRRADTTSDDTLHRVLDAARSNPAERVVSLMLANGSRSAGLSGAVAERLAAAAEAAGERVLLVDAAPAARPGGSPGLLDVIAGGLSLDMAVKRAQAGIERLGPGARASGPVGWQQGEGIRRFLAQAARRYDLTIIDAGSVAEGAPAAALAAACDAVLVTAERGRSRQRDLIECVEALQGGGASIAAAILSVGRRSA